jgi:hypothetical protein
MRGRAWLMAAALIGCGFAGIRSANAQDATPRRVDALPGRIAPAVTPVPIGALEADSDVRSAAKTSLILAGSLSVGAMYAASLAVASTSDNPADRYLAIPIAGPWIDLASRDECRAGAPAEPQLDDGESTPAPTKPSTCSARGAVRDDDASRALLAANGVTQGLGLLSVVTGILIPSAKGKTVTIRPRAGLTSMAVEATARF